MTEVEISLRAQLDGAMKKILSLTAEIEDLKTRQKERDEQTSLRVAFETRRDLATTLSGLERKLDDVAESGLYSETRGFNDAVQKCVEIVKKS